LKKKRGGGVKESVTGGIPINPRVKGENECGQLKNPAKIKKQKP